MGGTKQQEGREAGGKSTPNNQRQPVPDRPAVARNVSGLRRRVSQSRHSRQLLATFGASVEVRLNPKTVSR